MNEAEAASGRFWCHHKVRPKTILRNFKNGRSSLCEMTERMVSIT